LQTSKLVYFIFDINSPVDSRRYQDVSVSEVRDLVDKGTLFSYLKEYLRHDIELGAFNDADEGELIKELKDISEAYEGSEDHRRGVRNSGLCLLRGKS
jgi:hypothetical protein